MQTFFALVLVFAGMISYLYRNPNPGQQFPDVVHYLPIWVGLVWLVALLYVRYTVNRLAALIFAVLASGCFALLVLVGKALKG